MNRRRDNIATALHDIERIPTSIFVGIVAKARVALAVEPSTARELRAKPGMEPEAYGMAVLEDLAAMLGKPAARG